MGNCLKTQLKESVNNDTLEKFGAASIVLRNAVPDAPANGFFIIIVAEPGCKITSRYGFKVQNEQNPSVTEYTTSSNQTSVFLDNIANNTLVIEDKSKLYGINLATEYFVTGNALFNGINGAIEFYNAKSVGSHFWAINYSNITGLNYITIESQDTFNIDSIVINNPNIIILVPNTAVNISDIASLTSLERIAQDVIGDIAYLPMSLITCNLANSGAEGSIEDFVNARINAGKNSGCVMFGYARYNNQVTYQGESFVTYCENNNITNAYIEWNGNNITVSGSRPASYIEPKSFYECAMLNKI